MNAGGLPGRREVLAVARGRLSTLRVAEGRGSPSVILAVACGRPTGM